VIPKPEHITNTVREPMTHQANQPNEAHKKRTRLRKKKSPQQNQTNYEHKPVVEQPAQKPANHGDLQDQHVINLR
jgi:hypothetical protein